MAFPSPRALIDLYLDRTHKGVQVIVGLFAIVGFVAACFYGVSGEAQTTKEYNQEIHDGEFIFQGIEGEVNVDRSTPTISNTTNNRKSPTIRGNNATVNYNEGSDLGGGFLPDALAVLTNLNYQCLASPVGGGLVDANGSALNLDNYSEKIDDFLSWSYVDPRETRHVLNIIKNEQIDENYHFVRDAGILIGDFVKLSRSDILSEINGKDGKISNDLREKIINIIPNTCKIISDTYNTVENKE